MKVRTTVVVAGWQWVADAGDADRQVDGAEGL